MIIGSGFSSLSSACYLANEGLDVHVYEKNEHFGGRAQRFSSDGFNFDMGPTWYWMPDVFETFFASFGKKPQDYYTLKKLDPAYQIYFGQSDSIIIPGSYEAIEEIFENIETGSGKKLKKFIANAKSNYEIAIKDLVYKPGISPLELVTFKTASKLNQFTSTISKEVAKEFKDKRLRQILEFPALFLGAKPSNTPAFYSFMNYADFGLGTWHPEKGMYAVVEGIVKMARELGVHFYNNAIVSKINVKNNKTTGGIINNELVEADIILSGADYHHTETLVEEEHRGYSPEYWNKKVFAPSALLYYLGFDKKIDNVSHHTLFFDTDFAKHAAEIYDHPGWPENPLFYTSFPSITDSFFAPPGKEAGVVLIPLAPGIKDDQEIREKYLKIVLDRFEKVTKQEVQASVIFKKSYCINDFTNDYNSYKGNAYGLANILSQTAFMRPKIKSKKINNLYFTGQLTVPGPGVPPSLISGKIAADLIIKDLN